MVQKQVTEERWTEIGARIAQAREKAGMSQGDLADLLELHVRAVGNYERGERIPWSRLPEFAEVLNVDLRWLLFGKEWQDPLDRIFKAIQGLPTKKELDTARKERRESKEALEANHATLEEVKTTMAAMQAAFEAAIEAMGGRRPTLVEVAKSAGEAHDRAADDRPVPSIQRRGGHRGSGRGPGG